MSYLKSFAAILAIFVLASCGADSKEKIKADSISMMEETVKIFEGIKDKATAEAAKPKLEALKKKAKEIESRAEALGLKKEDLEKEMKDDKKMAELMGKMMGAMMKIGMNKEIQEALGDVMK